MDYRLKKCWNKHKNKRMKLRLMMMCLNLNGPKATILLFQKTLKPKLNIWMIILMNKVKKTMGLEISVIKKFLRKMKNKNH